MSHNRIPSLPSGLTPLARLVFQMDRAAGILSLGLLLACAGAQAFEAGTPAEPDRFTEAALCVATLEREVKSSLHPDPTQQERGQWQQRLEGAFAHMGDAYRDGLSGNAGKALLHAAESEVATWPPDRLEPQARSCELQGNTLLQQASGLQKLLVRRSAQRLLERELAKLAQPPAR